MDPRLANLQGVTKEAGGERAAREGPRLFLPLPDRNIGYSICGGVRL